MYYNYKKLSNRYAEHLHILLLFAIHTAIVEIMSEWGERLDKRIFHGVETEIE